MKKLLLLVLLPLVAFGQPRNGPYPTPTSPFLVQTPNVASNEIHFTSWLFTNVFSTTWGVISSTDTNGFGLVSTVITNGGIQGTNVVNANGIVNHTMLLTNGQKARFLTSFSITNFVDNGGADFGYSTNASGIPTDNGNSFGFGFSGSDPRWGQIRNANLNRSLPSWGTLRITNTTYGVHWGADESNYFWSVTYPGHSNEVRGYVAYASATASPIVSNVFIELNSTNLTLYGFGGRTASQTINPRTSIEGLFDTIVRSQDAHVTAGQGQPDFIRISLPALMDSGTNLPDLLVYCHGNSGNDLDAYDALDAEGGLGVRDYFNILNSNNIIVASFSGDTNVLSGRQDTWGTSNSITCVNSILSYIRAKYPYRYLFFQGDSAGVPTALDYAASHHEVKAVLISHGVGSITNLYAANSNNVNAAYGGLTAAQFQTTLDPSIGYYGDPYGIPPAMFNGISIMSVASYGDTTTIKTNQTDLIVLELGGQVGTSNASPTLSLVLNSPMGNPVLIDYGVNGAAGLHGGLCYTPAVTDQVLTFLNLVRVNAKNDVNALSGRQNVFGDFYLSGGFASSATNTLAVTSSGVTNNTVFNYMITVTAGTAMTLKDGNGNGIINPVLNESFPLKPGWKLTGTAVTAQGYQFP